MKLDQLHADADLVRRHSLPLAAVPHRAGADTDLPPATADDWMHDSRSAPADAGAQGCGQSAFAEGAFGAAEAVDAHAPAASRLPPLFSAEDEPWPAPPPPTGAARVRAAWIGRLARLAAGVQTPRDAVAGGADTAQAAAPTRRQINLAPWLAAGVIGIVLLALAAGLISHQRIDAEAAQLVEAKRHAAEQALSLLHAADRSTAGASARPPDAPVPNGATPVGESALQPIPELPAGRERHDAMLAAIKGGTVLASLPPSALAQPSALPAELPPPNAVAGAARTGAAPGAPRPPKKVALLVEGAATTTARTAPAADPLAATAVRGTLKGAAAPQHRVYQLRESDGEWLGFIARADADPLAAGVWAGSGDLLAGGWRVAEVTSQRLTLVGANGALEILRP